MAFLDAVDVEQATVVGHSGGSFTAASTTKNKPARTGSRSEGRHPAPALLVAIEQDAQATGVLIPGLASEIDQRRR